MTVMCHVDFSSVEVNTLVTEIMLDVVKRACKFLCSS